MDIDILETLPGYNNSNTQSSGRKPFIAPVDDAHPFDLESYISGYSGQSKSLI
jgi:COP9 signalosome complex subunit 1